MGTTLTSGNDPPSVVGLSSRRTSVKMGDIRRVDE
jgi:hypothetical protein